MQTRRPQVVHQFFKFFFHPTVELYSTVIQPLICILMYCNFCPCFVYFCALATLDLVTFFFVFYLHI